MCHVWNILVERFPRFHYFLLQDNVKKSYAYVEHMINLLTLNNITHLLQTSFSVLFSLELSFLRLWLTSCNDKLFWQAELQTSHIIWIWADYNRYRYPRSQLACTAGRITPLVLTHRWLWNVWRYWVKDVVVHAVKAEVSEYNSMYLYTKCK